MWVSFSCVNHFYFDIQGDGDKWLIYIEVLIQKFKKFCIWKRIQEKGQFQYELTFFIGNWIIFENESFYEIYLNSRPLGIRVSFHNNVQDTFRRSFLLWFHLKNRHHSL